MHMFDVEYFYSVHIFFHEFNTYLINLSFSLAEIINVLRYAVCTSITSLSGCNEISDSESESDFKDVNYNNFCYGYSLDISMYR